MFLDERELEEFERQEAEKRSFRLPSTLTISLLAHVGLSLFVLSQVEPWPEVFRPLPTTPVLLARAENANRTNVRFYDLPPRPKESPARNAEWSDADRRAHGGNPDLPKAARPSARGDERFPVPAPNPSGPSGAPRPAAPPESVRSGRGESQKPPAGSAPSLLALRAEPNRDERDAKSSKPADAAKNRWTISPSEVVVSRDGASGGGTGPDSSADDAGFVDEEGLSFDTQWFDWGPYGAEMVRRIRENWRIPGLARDGIKGIVVIRFFIVADGSIEDERIVRSSGIPPFDNASFHAIADAAPFAPLPKDLGSTREGVTIRFYYNIHPGGASAQEGEGGGAARKPNAPR